MNQPVQNGEFHRADPIYRRTMQYWLAASVVAGATLLVILNVWLRRLYSTIARADMVAYELWMDRLLAGLCLMLGIGMAVFGVWLYGLARKTRVERRWPPGSMKTSTDVRIRYLTSADVLVQQMQVAAWALWLLAAALAAWAGWLLFAP
jgi:ABC-type uncharacterized transport system fused permease/ATPase subunit